MRVRGRGRVRVRAGVRVRVRVRVGVRVRNRVRLRVRVRVRVRLRVRVRVRVGSRVRVGVGVRVEAVRRALLVCLEGHAKLVLDAQLVLALLAEHALQLLHLRLELLHVAPALAALAVGGHDERLDVELELGPQSDLAVELLLAQAVRRLEGGTQRTALLDQTHVARLRLLRPLLEACHALDGHLEARLHALLDACQLHPHLLFQRVHPRLTGPLPRPLIRPVTAVATTKAGVAAAATTAVAATSGSWTAPATL